ncbi:hypothetical protein BT67DRAFT_269099 [Trichocladium antarcticum]|uniref:Uncharacterized protein n=1 Tax=Trichocladium antarcticum TaxID=1450529 RepID=A0AAN6ZEC7_9PEZI|nr:hypothetical protein BT67DRAFT_269099 [Trichocladium antarcticum]
MVPPPCTKYIYTCPQRHYSRVPPSSSPKHTPKRIQPYFQTETTHLPRISTTPSIRKKKPPPRNGRRRILPHDAPRPRAPRTGPPPCRPSDGARTTHAPRAPAQQQPLHIRVPGGAERGDPVGARAAALGVGGEKEEGFGFGGCVRGGGGGGEMGRDGLEADDGWI